MKYFYRALAAFAIVLAGADAALRKVGRTVRSVWSYPTRRAATPI